VILYVLHSDFEMILKHNQLVRTLYFTTFVQFGLNYRSFLALPKKKLNKIGIWR